MLMLKLGLLFNRWVFILSDRQLEDALLYNTRRLRLINNAAMKMALKRI